MYRQKGKLEIFGKPYSGESKTDSCATIDFGALERKALAQASDEWHKQLPEYTKYGLTPPSLQTMLDLVRRKFADMKLCLDRDTFLAPNEVACFLRDIKLAEEYSVGIPDITKESNTKQMEE